MLRLSVGISPIEIWQLVRFAIPFLGIGRGIDYLGNDGPAFGQLRIDLEEMLLIVGNVVVGEDGLGGTLRDAQRAIDALIRIDDQKVRAFVEAIHRTNFDAIGVFTLDAVISHDVGHMRVLQRLGITL
jgi:hypothetical protein